MKLNDTNTLFAMFLCFSSCSTRTIDSHESNVTRTQAVEAQSGNQSQVEAPSAGAAGFSIEGNERGNGGDAVICLDTLNLGELSSVQSLDYLEARADGQIFVYLGNQGDTEPGKISTAVFKKVQILISRIGYFDATRAIKYTQWLDEFPHEANISPGVSLIDIPDEGELSDHPGCFLLQAAKQIIHPQENLKRYEIDGRLWNRLDADNQASLIMHELIYRDAIQLGQTNSSNVRKLNAKLMDLDFTSMSRTDYLNLTTSLGF